jgi:hypothetical protein
VEHVIHAAKGRFNAAGLPDIPDVVLDTLVTELVAHVVLLLLVAAEDADLRKV